MMAIDTSLFLSYYQHISCRNPAVSGQYNCSCAFVMPRHKFFHRRTTCSNPKSLHQLKEKGELLVIYFERGKHVLQSQLNSYTFYWFLNLNIRKSVDLKRSKYSRYKYNISNSLHNFSIYFKCSHPKNSHYQSNVNDVMKDLRG